MNTSSFTESIQQHISKNTNDFVGHDIHPRRNEKFKVPLFQYVEAIPLNKTTIDEISNIKTASQTRYHLPTSSSENGERNERISITRSALRIAARQALEATHNLYDKIEPDIIRQGSHENITF